MFKLISKISSFLTILAITLFCINKYPYGKSEEVLRIEKAALQIQDSKSALQARNDLMRIEIEDEDAQKIRQFSKNGDTDITLILQQYSKEIESIQKAVQLGSIQTSDVKGAINASIDFLKLRNIFELYMAHVINLSPIDFEELAEFEDFIFSSLKTHGSLVSKLFLLNRLVLLRERMRLSGYSRGFKRIDFNQIAEAISLSEFIIFKNTIDDMISDGGIKQSLFYSSRLTLNRYVEVSKASFLSPCIKSEIECTHKPMKFYTPINPIGKAIVDLFTSNINGYKKLYKQVEKVNAFENLDSKINL